MVENDPEVIPGKYQHYKGKFYEVIGGVTAIVKLKKNWWFTEPYMIAPNLDRMLYGPDPKKCFKKQLFSKETPFPDSNI